MNAIFLTLFVSGVLVLGMVLLFAFLFAHRSHEQSDRLSLLPLQNETTKSQTTADKGGAAALAARKLR